MRVLFVLILVLVPPAVLAISLAGTGAGSTRSMPDGRSASNAAFELNTIDLRSGDDDDDDDDFAGVAEFFVDDPLVDPDFIIEGAAFDRLSWRQDDPAYPGDFPGSLASLYDSSLPAAALGVPLPVQLDQDDAFTAAAVFVIESDDFSADPDGFFQISWGLWNRVETGLNRTGNFDDFASDSFELIEFSWFPNVSPFFGGPFLGPSVFGEATGDDPDAFLNGSFLFGLQVDLPRDTPLMTVMRHRPGSDALVTQVYSIDMDGRVLPVNGAVGVVPLGFLASRFYSVDAVGPTLWNDGFGGTDPAVRATLIYHAIIVAPGVVENPQSLLP